MIKDPLNKDETPYDLLDLNPNVHHSEILNALHVFMKNPKNRARIPKAQEARRKLMNSRDRAAVDILYYCVGLISADDNETIDLNADIKDFIAVPFLMEDEYFSDLKKNDFESDFREIRFNELTVNEINRYDFIKCYKLDASFDR